MPQLTCGQFLQHKNSLGGPRPLTINLLDSLRPADNCMSQVAQVIQIHKVFKIQKGPLQT